MKSMYLLLTGIVFLSGFGITCGQELTILHTNDMHSKLTGFGPESEYSPQVTGNDSTRGGFARLATILEQAREKSPDKIVILDAGDFLMGSLFHVAEEETGFQLNLMKRMGYDYVTFGNHEFEFGPETLASIIKSAGNRGGHPQIIASNTVFSKKSDMDDGLEQLCNTGVIQPYSIITKNKIKIGIIGLVGIDAASVAPASKPVTFTDPVKAASKWSDYLKKEHNADLIIALSHCGILPDATGTGYTGEDIELARKVPAIDIIISGHTHVLTPGYIRVGDTYIIQAGSYAAQVGEIKLKYEHGSISDFNFNIIAVDDNVKGDSAINDEIEKQADYIDQRYLAVTGLTCDEKIAKTNFNLNCDFTDLKNSNLGPFLADASFYYLESTGNHADFSLVASGTIREDIVTGMHGLITVADVFRVMSLGEGYDNVPGYPLAKIYLTAYEVKQLMEVLLISRAGGGDGYIYFSGIKTYIDPDKGLLKKVQKIEIDGKEINLSKDNKTLYSLAANTYLLSFFGRIRKLSHGMVKITLKDKYGNPVTDMKAQLVDIKPEQEGIQEAKEWLAVIEYMRSFEKNSDNMPEIPDIYRKPESSVVSLK